MDELSLCLVTDRAQTRGRDLVTLVRECLAAGLPAVQVREKDLGAGDLAALCRQIRGATREHGAQLVVNDRVDVALAVGADAVQRTHTSLTVNDRSKRIRHDYGCSGAPPELRRLEQRIDEVAGTSRWTGR